jgi:hypothetical protein
VDGHLLGVGVESCEVLMRSAELSGFALTKKTASKSQISAKSLTNRGLMIAPRY